jgi:PHD/YefM family antitoxin component YafN of YafNO toxin-antitoxin module
LIAVLISSEEYEQIQNTLDIAEDIVLGFMAQERFKKSKDSDYIDIEALLK